MSMLQALGIAGFRSYSPVGFQKLEFQTPLTLIWGKNGSGKTTIIEVLKYITTGALPPSCDKGKNFLMDPKLINESEMAAETRLKFKAYNGRPVLAKRRALLSVTTKGAKFQSVEQTLKTKDQHGQLFEINHQCAQIQKQIPQLLGISKAVLENIVFCHQEQSLWPFSDNANLKAIFDQMFQTRRYTKIIEAFWEQHKEYMKEIKETKKSLEYLKRLHEDDNRRKMKALREIEAVADMASKLPAMQEKMQSLSRSHDPAESMRKKYLLGLSRGSLKEKHTTINRTIQEVKEKMKGIQIDYGFSLLMEMPVIGSGKEALEEIERRIEEANVAREDLKRELQECQNAQVFSQKQMEVSGEVKRAKQCLPELKNQEDEMKVLKFLESRCQFMETRRTQLAKLRRQAEQVTVPSLLDLPLSEHAYQEQKRLLAFESNKLSACKQEILGMFALLHKAIPAHRPQQHDSNIQQHLQEVRLRLKLKREQLEAYQSMPEGASFQERRIKLEYGSTFQHEIIGYCQDKKKCFVCSRQLNETEIRNIKARGEKSIGKHNKKLEELQQDRKRRGEEQGVDPKQIIPVLRRDIARAEEEEAKLALEFEEYSQYRQHQEQDRLNNKLMAGLRKVGLDREPRSAKPHPNASPEAFQEKLMEYQGIRMGLQSGSRDLRLYEERVNRNQELQRQRESAMSKTNDLREQIISCERDTLNYDILTNISKRLAALLNLRGNRRPGSKQKASQNEAPSPEQINKKISAANKQIRALELQRQYCILSTQLKDLQPEGLKLTGELSSLESQLSVVEKEYDAGCKEAAQHARLQLQLVSKKREVDLKADLAFQEYYTPVEKEYPAMLLHLNTREAVAKDIQAHCKALEAAVCAFHKEKMELVNKYLAEIWREIYHGQDITLIEIQAAFEEDSKRRRSYSYAILMEKGGKKLEMKGRCSMGQKVLASIVIRLALAEVFGNSARILALDEPTTNLDREHIANLAHQLARLVEMNENKYLQMIIISHDLEFVRMMEKYTPCYYEVSRDQKRCSVITRKEIREIYEAKLEGQ